MRHVSGLPQQTPDIFAPLTSLLWEVKAKKCHHLLGVWTEYDVCDVQTISPLRERVHKALSVFVCVCVWTERLDGDLSNKEMEKKKKALQCYAFPRGGGIWLSL